jgi:spore coat-associated protein N
MSTKMKLLISAGIVGAAASVAGLGTFGTFTSSTSASEDVASGTVSIALGTAGTASNRLTVGATGLVPGDTLQRQVKLSNDGNQALADVTLTTTATQSSLLDTDATNGLQMTVKSCPAAWSEAGTAPAFSYTCSGTPTTVVDSRPVITTGTSLTGLNTLASGGSDNLLVTVTFPSTAGNALQNQTSTVNFTFTGTQRAGTNK